MEKNPEITKPSYSEHSLPIPCVEVQLYCDTIQRVSRNNSQRSKLACYHLLFFMRGVLTAFTSLKYLVEND